jgi:virginiamycin B lyase
MMRMSRLFAVTIAAVAVILVSTAVDALRAQPQAAVALTGHVTSAAEGAMEGVVVSAVMTGSTVMTSVISDRDGRFRFPAANLTPGRYTLQIRAVGYDLAKPATVTVAAQNAVNVDLRLTKTHDLASQLTNAEWIESVPGTLQQKSGLISCVDCHTLQRVVTSTHTADDFLHNVLPRMENYANMSFWLRPQAFQHPRTGRGGFANPEFAAYLASINLSSGPRKYALKTLPRPKRRSTQVVITEYALPQRQIQPHDVVVAPDGMVWYSDFGQQFIGELNPKTAKVTQFRVPEVKPGYLTGGLDLELDKTGNLWLGMMYQGGIARFDTKTHAFKVYAVAPAENPEYTQESMIMPWQSNVDGKVWTNNQDDHSFRRLDIATGTFDELGPYTYPNSKDVFRSYGIAADAQNNAWLFDFAHSAIAKLDAKTKEITIIPTPTENSHPRRGRVDPSGVFWFAEYGANRIGMYDTNVTDGKIKEFLMPTPWTEPYDVIYDKHGELWTGSMLTDRVVRLDPKTGESVEYMMPNDTNIRRVFVDNSTTPVTFWTGSNHGAAIVKVQPLN